MKKILSIILTGLIILNVCGFNLIFGLLLLSCKYEAEETIDNLSNSAGLVHFVISDKNKNDFVRVNKKEIKYKNEMYDIVKETRVADEVHILCFNDKHEDNLLETMNKLDNVKKEKSLPAAKSGPSYALNNLIKNFISPKDINIRNLFFNINYCSLNNVIDYNNISEIPYPPPKHSNDLI